MQRYRIYIKNGVYMVKFKNTADRTTYLALSAENSSVISWSLL